MFKVSMSSHTRLVASFFSFLLSVLLVRASCPQVLNVRPAYDVPPRSAGTEIEAPRTAFIGIIN